MRVAAVAETDALLRDHLETTLPEYFGGPVVIKQMHREPFEMQTSFAAQILTLRLGNDSPPLKLFVKDFSSSVLAKDGLEQRSNREHRVYRDLLAGQNLDTAHYFGAVRKPGQRGFYLLLEFVDGMWLKYRDFDDWIKAAAWLGKLHGTFISRQDDLAKADFLLKHDAGFFNTKAAAALDAVAGFSAGKAEQLAEVLNGYDRFVDVMATQPVTLVHGSFRVQNIQVSSTGGATRICPVDWELAAAGGGLLDLAFIAHGYAPDEVAVLLAAYREQLGRYSVPWADEREMTHVINCYLLHKVLKSLSDSKLLNFSPATVDKLLIMAKDIRRTLNTL